MGFRPTNGYPWVIIHVYLPPMEFHVEVQVDYLSRLDLKRWGDHIMRCPKCNEPVWTWLVAGVRYEYVGQLEGTARFLSELQQGSDSDDSDNY